MSTLLWVEEGEKSECDIWLGWLHRYVVFARNHSQAFAQELVFSQHQVSMTVWKLEVSVISDELPPAALLHPEVRVLPVEGTVKRDSSSVVVI